MGTTSYVSVPLFSGQQGLDEGVAGSRGVGAAGAVPLTFTAWLSDNSPLSFNVSPPEGVLSQQPAEGEQQVGAFTPTRGRRQGTGGGLVVSYTCRDFGKTMKGQLYVQTSDGKLHWCVGCAWGKLHQWAGLETGGMGQRV